MAGYKSGNIIKKFLKQCLENYPCINSIGNDKVKDQNDEIISLE
jgi:hypothetical protein